MQKLQCAMYVTLSLGLLTTISFVSYKSEDLQITSIFLSGYENINAIHQDWHGNVPYTFGEDAANIENVFVFRNMCIEMRNGSFSSIAVYDPETEHSGRQKITVALYFHTQHNVTVRFMKKHPPINTRFMSAPAFVVPIRYPENIFHFFHTFLTGK